MCSFRFVVDRIRFRAMHYAVDNILMDCIFPSKVKLQKSLNVEQVSKPNRTLYIMQILCCLQYVFVLFYIFTYTYIHNILSILYFTMS